MKNVIKIFRVFFVVFFVSACSSEIEYDSETEYDWYGHPMTFSQIEKGVGEQIKYIVWTDHRAPLYGSARRSSSSSHVTTANDTHRVIAQFKRYVELGLTSGPPNFRRRPEKAWGPPYHYAYDLNYTDKGADLACIEINDSEYGKDAGFVVGTRKITEIVGIENEELLFQYEYTLNDIGKKINYSEAGRGRTKLKYNQFDKTYSIEGFGPKMLRSGNWVSLSKKCRYKDSVTLFD